MTENRKASGLSNDPQLPEIVKQLRTLATKHPKALSLKVALEAILGGLIHEAFGVSAARGEAPRTIAVLVKLADLFPESPLPLLHLSKVCIDAGDHQEALKYAEAGLRIDRADADLVFNRALCLLQLGKTRMAIAEFKRCIKLDPDNPWAYTNIGDACRTLKLYDQAEQYLKSAIECDSAFVSAHHNLALLYMDRKDWAHCVQSALVAEKLGPLNREVQLALGDGYMGLRKYNSALEHLVLATLVDRDFVPAYETMSAAYVELGMYDLSLAAAREALKRNPRSWMALANIGYSYSKQNRFADATKPLLEAIEYAPDQGTRSKLCGDLSWNYLQIDQHREAMDCIERAIQLKDDPDITLLFTKALILLAQGRPAAANAAYEDAIKRVDTKHPKAIREGLRDHKEFLAKKRIKVDRKSPLYQILKNFQDNKDD